MLRQQLQSAQQRLSGEYDPQFQKILRIGIIAAFIAFFGVAAFAFASFFAVPFAVSVVINSLFTGGVMYLGGISYGIINDIIGCKRNLPYFMLGHQPGQRGIIKSNDPTAVGITWGIAATAVLSIVAAVLFAGVTLIMGFCGLPFAGFALPLIASLIPMMLVRACLKANQQFMLRKKGMSEDQYSFNAIKGSLLFKKQFLNEEYLDEYQQNRLRAMLETEDDVNEWMANSDRNVQGFIWMPVIGVVGLVSMITFSAAHIIPAVLFTAAFSAFPPLAIGALLAVGVAAACFYLYKNHNKQIDNKYRLDYPEDTVQAPQAYTPQQKTGLAPRQALLSSHAETSAALLAAVTPTPIPADSEAQVGPQPTEQTVPQNVQPPPQLAVSAGSNGVFAAGNSNQAVNQNEPDVAAGATASPIPNTL